MKYFIYRLNIAIVLTYAYALRYYLVLLCLVMTYCPFYIGYVH